MAGDSRIAYGYGYVFDAAGIEDEIEDLEYQKDFPRNLLVKVDPFHGVESQEFAVLAKSTYFSGDPADGETPLGIHHFNETPTEAENGALEDIFEKLKDHLVSGPQTVLSITADV